MERAENVKQFADQIAQAFASMRELFESHVLKFPITISASDDAKSSTWVLKLERLPVARDLGVIVEDNQGEKFHRNLAAREPWVEVVIRDPDYKWQTLPRTL